ncbi:MAG: class I SAM-dependent methyltransferase [Methylophilaceae bacterium]|jgi:cyclopropane-fatty-acyl-phospholipid synthase|nr:MAG: class I SAM-dependent methyltransferase [Methylophilaceae bacterium]
MINKTASEQLLKRLEQLSWGTLTLTTPDGKVRTFTGQECVDHHAHLVVHDWSVITHLIRKGDIGFADDYRSGKWDTDDINKLVQLGLNNQMAMQDMVAGNKLYNMLSSLFYLFRLNTIKGSKKNIHAHYDLGNAFYQLWLDPSMTYSSALFKTEQDSLTQAQHHKYDRMLDCMQTQSGRLLEVGCGWGGLAERAINRGDYEIKGITLSEEQHNFAQARLGNNVHIALEDYRHQTGIYDRILSIEMFEAVGERFWPVYFQKLKSLLAKNGKAVVQTITINEKDFPAYRRGGDFIRSFIFPGGMLPSVSRFKQEAEKAGLKTHTPFMFGQDYARTLETWLTNFDQQKQAITALGFDDGFIRLWRFYLATCAAGFRVNKTDVMQMEMSHA